MSFDLVKNRLTQTIQKYEPVFKHSQDIKEDVIYGFTKEEEDDSGYTFDMWLYTGEYIDEWSLMQFLGLFSHIRYIMGDTTSIILWQVGKRRLYFTLFIDKEYDIKGGLEEE